jgi:hypothetical protein
MKLSNEECKRLAEKWGSKEEHVLIESQEIWLYKTPEDKEDHESPYCDVCESCGEGGCCSVEKSLLGHNCKYGEYYAKEVYYNEMLIDELLKLLESKGVCRDETGDVVIDPIGDAYDRAYNRALEKYGK